MNEQQCLNKLEEHIKACAKCGAAHKRVNDFCGVGRVLFVDWVHAGAQPVSLEVLSKEESARVIGEMEREIRKAGLN